MRNIRIVIEYEGTRYHGWQRQKNEETIQEILERKIGQITGEQIVLIGSGRTDAGVHALNQVANFKTHSAIGERNLLQAINSLVPSDIVLKSLTAVHDDFHARHDAKKKRYCYKILNHPVRSALYKNYVWHIYSDLDIAAMRSAALCLKGTHDFSSFCASGCGCVGKIRTVTDIAFTVIPDGVILFSIEADGFLRYMVRNIVGTLVDVGRGKIIPASVIDILEARDRTQAGITAPPQGLFLEKVYY
jgi:tRNA pseudouridine38-40 synthase